MKDRINRREALRTLSKSFAYVAGVSILVPKAFSQQQIVPVRRKVAAAGGGGTGCVTIKDKFDTSLDTAQFVEVGSGGLSYALSFVAGSTYNGCDIELWVQKEGTPSFNIKIAIQTDLGGSLGPSQIENGNEITVAASAFSTTEGWQRVVGLNPIIVSGVKYWIKMVGTGGNATNNVHWIRDSGSSPAHDQWATFDEDEAAWFANDTTIGYGFRIYEA